MSAPGLAGAVHRLECLLQFTMCWAWNPYGQGSQPGSVHFWVGHLPFPHPTALQWSEPLETTPIKTRIHAHTQTAVHVAAGGVVVTLLICVGLWTFTLRTKILWTATFKNVHSSASRMYDYPWSASTPKQPFYVRVQFVKATPIAGGVPVEPVHSGIFTNGGHEHLPQATSRDCDGSADSELGSWLARHRTR